MGKEVERKFLVLPSFFNRKRTGKEVCQGYVINTPNKKLRIRLIDNKAILTLKGKRVSITRAEFNIKVNASDGKDILASMCEGTPIEKIRYKSKCHGKQWIVDEFKGDNEGLLIAEIELKSEDEVFDKPKWLGREVTDDDRYYNDNLITNPYCNWKNEAAG